jgi:hypothetical protein
MPHKCLDKFNKAIQLYRKALHVLNIRNPKRLRQLLMLLKPSNPTFCRRCVKNTIKNIPEKTRSMMSSTLATISSNSITKKSNNLNHNTKNTRAKTRHIMRARMSKAKNRGLSWLQVQQLCWLLALHTTILIDEWSWRNDNINHASGMPGCVCFWWKLLRFWMLRRWWSDPCDCERIFL